MDRDWKNREGEERPEEVAAMRSRRSCAGTTSQLGGGMVLESFESGVNKELYSNLTHCNISLLLDG